MNEYKVKTDPLPFWCIAGDHRADISLSIATGDSDYATHDHEWVWAPRTRQQLDSAGYSHE